MPNSAQSIEFRINPLVLVGFQFKPKVSCVLAVLNGASVGLAYIVSQGNITATIVWFVITTGVTTGISYYKEQQQ